MQHFKTSTADTPLWNIIFNWHSIQKHHPHLTQHSEHHLQLSQTAFWNTDNKHSILKCYLSWHSSLKYLQLTHHFETSSTSDTVVWKYLQLTQYSETSSTADTAFETASTSDTAFWKVTYCQCSILKDQQLIQHFWTTQHFETSFWLIQNFWTLPIDKSFWYIINNWHNIKKHHL